MRVVRPVLPLRPVRPVRLVRLVRLADARRYGWLGRHFGVSCCVNSGEHSHSCSR